MSELELFSQILKDANLATPAIAGIIGIIRAGRKAGKSDDDIKAESMQFALETRAQTETDESNKP